jgi:hypothetical protein
MPQADRGMCRHCVDAIRISIINDSESEARYCSHYSSFKFPSQKDASILFVDFARDLDTVTAPRREMPSESGFTGRCLLTSESDRRCDTAVFKVSESMLLVSW